MVTTNTARVGISPRRRSRSGQLRQSEGRTVGEGRSGCAIDEISSDLTSHFRVNAHQNDYFEMANFGRLTPEREIRSKVE